MAKVIELGSVKEFRLRKMEEELDGLEHPDPKIREEWLKMAKAAYRKYPGPPAPSMPNLSFPLPASVSEDETVIMQKKVQEFIERIKSDFMGQHLEMLRDIILLQKELAELRSEHNK
ncbi:MULTISPECIES: hypothetical protein [unclassified Pseudoalteromonas]|uniref:hypothetical protein n=1 Tax=unclassified Pseudoalteromonas TaxID=194690 RepID=UPI0023590645|nr:MULTISPECIES: hypothetical protein [unclassified Pseudoalteromonas]MDC9575649.1 hypothetical protein [Pseudoalteromonas sp. GABNS16A]MDC9611987.1 hypothetical protein [Pseudoalteromonas sp. GABNS16H]